MTTENTYHHTLERRQSKSKGLRVKALVRRNNRTIQSKTFDTEKEANEWAEECIWAMRTKRREHIDTRQLLRTVGDLIDRYMVPEDDDENRGLLKLKESSQLQRGKQCLWWKDQLGHIRLADLEPDDIRKALKEYRQGQCTRYCVKTRRAVAHSRPRSPASRNRLLAAFRTACKFGIDVGWLKVSPAATVRNLAEPKGRVRFLSHEEEDALLTAARGSDASRLWLYLRGLMTSGARDMEWRAMTWDRVDLDAGTAFVADTKNGDSKSLALSDDVIAELRKFREIGTGYVFPSARPGRIFDFRKSFAAAKKQAGLDFPKDHPKYLRVHDLRHHAASVLVAAGAEALQVAEVLGHRSLQSTRRYSHLAPQKKTDLVQQALKAREASRV